MIKSPNPTTISQSLHVAISCRASHRRTATTIPQAYYITSHHFQDGSNDRRTGGAADPDNPKCEK